MDKHWTTLSDHLVPHNAYKLDQALGSLRDPKVRPSGEMKVPDGSCYITLGKKHQSYRRRSKIPRKTILIHQKHKARYHLVVVTRQSCCDLPQIDARKSAKLTKMGSLVWFEHILL